MQSWQNSPGKEAELHTLTLTPLRDIGEIHPGEDLAETLSAALTRLAVATRAHDVLVVAQKAVSKAENRYVDLETVLVTERAAELAERTRKDPRLVQLILDEATEIVRAEPNILIVRHRLGFVMANAGIDRSNVPGAHRVLLLPLDPDNSAAALRERIARHCGADLGVIISDSFGRPWRRGVTQVALGAAGIPALIDRRGEPDRNGRRLEVTEVAFADQVASAAGLVMGEGAESYPAVLVSGLSWKAPIVPANVLVRPLQEDLFR